MEIQEEAFSLTPPTAERVAARALVLSAVSCRGCIEEHAGKPGAEELRQEIRGWIEDIGVAAELEQAEAALLSTPLGELDDKTVINATWRSEGMVVLAWALGYVQLPPVHVECEPSDVAHVLGFLHERENTPLHCPHLRDSAEIEHMMETYLALHWRLVEFSIHPGTTDFVRYASDGTLGPLPLDELEIQDRDLAIDGIRIDKVDYAAYRHALSIAQERHKALNWLLGFEMIYSDVTTDT